MVYIWIWSNIEEVIYRYAAYDMICFSNDFDHGYGLSYFLLKDLKSCSSSLSLLQFLCIFFYSHIILNFFFDYYFYSYY